MKKLRKYILICAFFLILGYAAGVALHYFTQEPKSIVESLTTDYAFVGLAGGAVIAIAYFVLSRPKSKKAVTAKTKGTTAGGKEMDWLMMLHGWNLLKFQSNMA